MKIQDAFEEFNNYLKTQNKQLESLTPASGIEALISFYRDERVDECKLENDGDMLLFQWGTHNWGQDEWFDLNITRQLIENNGEDDDIWQLSLTWKYQPSEVLKGFSSGNRWCLNPQEVAGFEAFIDQSMAFGSLSQSQAEAVELSYFKAG